MRSSRLANTRQLAKKRLVIIVLLLFLVPALYVGPSHQSSAAESTATTTSTTSRPGEVFLINKTVLVELVNNKTNIEFVPSTGNLSYCVVRSATDHEVFGLVYYTTDVALEWTYGYSSNVGVLVYVDTNGTIQNLNAPTHELAVWPWPFLITRAWLQTLVGRNVYEPLVMGQDVQGVTSATQTSRAIVNGLREGGRRVVDNYRMTASQQKEKPSNVQEIIANTIAMLEPKSSVETLAVIGLYASAIVAYGKNSKRLKYVVMGTAIIFIGFYTGRMVSIVDMTLLPQAGLPPLLSNTYWYALFGLALITSLVWGRLYCGYLCPFGAFTQILHDISPLKVDIPQRLHGKLVYAKYIVLAAVVVGVILGDLWVTGLEPFVTFFFLRGEWWMWAVMGGAVLASIPANRFFCRYLCPAGAVLSLIGGLRLEEIKRWPECGRCRVCERMCPSRAIAGPKISALECLNCRECEKNYLNVDVCPHYGLERLNS
jgi:Pyruvate/2-oxoacid:ferredoxin oxidoreductase delta subunit